MSENVLLIVLRVAYWIIGSVIFIVSWGYAINQYGFFLGISLGWIPALLLAIILPPLLLVLIPIAFIIFLNYHR